MKIRLLIFLLTILALAGFVGYQIWDIYLLNEQHFIYPLDDAYIHLAIGKNLAQHGVWGITNEGFTSSSSSLLYTLLLAGSSLITTSNEYAPLLINILSAFFILGILYRISQKEQLGAGVYAVLGLGTIFFTPLPAIIISGMEHTLQIFLFLWFFYEGSKYITENRKGKSLLLICVLAFLAVMIRFEGIFLIAAFCLLLLFRRQYKELIWIALAGALPLILFGLYSVANDALPLPNSLLLKGRKPKTTILGLLAFAFHWLEKLFNNPHLLFPFIFMAISLISSHKLPKKLAGFERNMLLWLLLTFVIHLTLAKTGWFYRYEAYLVTLSLLVLALCLDKLIKNYSPEKEALSKGQLVAVCSLGLIILFHPLALRAAASIQHTPVATRNIYEQQIQMARFLSAHFPEEAVVANDIGAISYFNDIRLFDMFGLANLDVLKLRLNKQYTKEEVDRLTRLKNSKIAIIYDHWFPGQIPEGWVKTGEWTIRNNVICGGETVSFYAVDASYKDKLTHSLQDFSSQLPEEVIQSGAYCRENPDKLSNL